MELAGQRTSAPRLLALFVATCSPEKPAAHRAPPEVGVMTVVPKTVPYVPTFVAQTESSRQVEIVARVAGFLDKIAYTEGETVKAVPAGVSSGYRSIRPK